MRSACLPVVLAGVAVFLIGCASVRSQGPGSGGSSSAIREIHLLAMPLGLNLDPSPGADGFAVKVFAVNPSQPKTQPIRAGKLEIRMYDGVVADPLAQTNQLLRVWSYAPEELVPFLFESPIGTGYAFTPQWETQRPRQDKITVFACIVLPENPLLCSAGSIITVGVR